MRNLPPMKEAISTFLWPRSYSHSGQLQCSSVGSSQQDGRANQRLPIGKRVWPPHPSSAPVHSPCQTNNYFTCSLLTSCCECFTYGQNYDKRSLDARLRLLPGELEGFGIERTQNCRSCVIRWVCVHVQHPPVGWLGGNENERTRCLNSQAWLAPTSRRRQKKMRLDISNRRILCERREEI